MHEIPIVRDMVDTLRQRYGERFPEIAKVQVEAGLLSNVQPILIQNAFEALIVEDKNLAHIDLEVVLLPIIARCTYCERDFKVKAHRFLCEICGKGSREIVQGKELRISKIDFLK